MDDRGIAQRTADRASRWCLVPSSDETSHAIAALATVGVVFVLAIADFLTVLLAVATVSVLEGNTVCGLNPNRAASYATKLGLTPSVRNAKS